MSEAPLCVATMLRDDYEFLEKWIAHYSQQVEERWHLYVVSHGDNERLRDIARGCSIITIPHFENGSQFEPRRRKMFFGLAAMLRNYFRHVITTDVDEFIVLDPRLNQSLAEYLIKRKFEGKVLSPIGFDVVHKPSVEPEDFDFARPLTEQRHHGYLEGAYSKPCIFREVPAPELGHAHYVLGEPWDIDINLMLFHMKWFDRSFGEKMAAKRFATVTGYEEHASTHRIGGWHNRAQKLNSAITRLETEEVTPLTPSAATAFALDMRTELEERGRFPWNVSQQGPFTIPKHFHGTV